MSQIGGAQLSFTVRQRAPATVDAAVAAVLELETYLQQPMIPVAPVMQEYQGCDKLDAAAASVTRRPEKDDPMLKIIERLDKLEAQLKQPRKDDQRTYRQGRRPVKNTCWNCKEEGHLARNCPLKQEKFRETSNPWSSKPSGQG